MKIASLRTSIYLAAACFVKVFLFLVALGSLRRRILSPAFVLNFVDKFTYHIKM